MVRVHPSSEELVSDRGRSPRNSFQHFSELLEVIKSKAKQLEEQAKNLAKQLEEQAKNLARDVEALDVEAGSSRPLRDLLEDDPSNSETTSLDESLYTARLAFSPEHQPVEDQHVEDSYVPPYLPIPIHAYSEDGFNLYGLPHPRLGEVVGLYAPEVVGKIGKTTAMNILAGKLMPNLGRPKDPPGWEEILNHLSIWKDQPGLDTLIGYLGRLKENELNVSLKTQAVSLKDLKVLYGDVAWLQHTQCFARQIIGHLSKENPYCVVDMCERLKIDSTTLTSNAEALSDKERQKLMIAIALLSNADVYLFDEPSKFLDRVENVEVAKAIQSVVNPKRYVFVADKDANLVKYVAGSTFEVKGIPDIHGYIESRD